jgi:hypothetical protein
MAKDKPKNKTSIADAVSKQADKELKSSGKIWTGSSGGATGPIMTSTPPMINTKTDLEMERKYKEYNESIKELDPMYSNLIPVSKILVRCYVMEYTRTEGGLLIKPIVTIPVPTQNGIGKIGDVETPFPYQTKAIVIAAPKRYEETYPVGATVQLSSSPIKAVSRGKDSGIDLPYAFTHASYPYPGVPANVEDRHYGYLLVPPMEIDVIMNM